MVRLLLTACLALGVLTACNKTWAPVEDRSSARGAYMATEDGTYRVRRGDSLHAIAFNFGLDWREIARWNGIEAPYVIYPDQVLRLGPAAEVSRSVTTTAARPYPSSSDRAATRDATPEPAPAPSAPAEPPRAQVPASQQAGEARSTPPPATRPPPSTTVGRADPTAWLWPVEGRLISRFRSNDPSRNGIEIGGKEGQPVRASADGEVVYSGNGLIGYGELIIIKHSDRMLSAYGHNRKRLVAEGQAVAAGEKIAEMGKDERNRSLLHFEIRRDGTPQDPLRYLPNP